MGREARLKRERKAERRADAWGKGIPTIVQLSQETYAQLTEAMQDTTKVEGLIAQIRNAATQKRAAAMTLAGLDPERTYRIDHETLVAELQV